MRVVGGRLCMRSARRQTVGEAEELTRSTVSELEQVVTSHVKLHRTLPPPWKKHSVKSIHVKKRSKNV